MDNERVGQPIEPMEWWRFELLTEGEQERIHEEGREACMDMDYIKGYIVGIIAGILIIAATKMAGS